MKSGGGLSASTVEVDDSDDSEDTVPAPTRGLKLEMVPGSSANWDRFAMDDCWPWRCCESGPGGAVGIEFWRTTGAGWRGGSGIEYERCTSCDGLVDESYIRVGSVRDERGWRGAGVGEPPSFPLAAFHPYTRGDGTTPCKAPLRCLFADVGNPPLLLLLFASSHVVTRGEGTTGCVS